MLGVYFEMRDEEGGAPKNGCLQTEVLEKTPESPLDSKETRQMTQALKAPFPLKDPQLRAPQLALHSSMLTWKIPWTGA